MSVESGIDVRGLTEPLVGLIILMKMKERMEPAYPII
jgi:hypothetical protein